MSVAVNDKLVTVSELKVAFDEMKPIRVSGTISSSNMVISDTRITADMIVTAYVIGTPTAQQSDWTVTTTAGAATITGSISGSTTLTLTLEREHS